MTFQATSASIGQLDLVELVTSLQERVRAVVEARLAAIDAEVSFVTDLVNEVDAAGLWNTFVQGPIEQVKAEFDAVFGDAKGTSDIGVAFEGMVKSFFDPESFVATKTAGVSSAPVLSATQQLSSPSGPTGLLSRVTDVGGAKSLTAANPAQRTISQALLSSVTDIAVGATSNVAKALHTAQSTVGYLLATVPETGAALLGVAVQNLDSLLVDQGVLLDQIEAVIEDIVDVVAKMGKNDYLTDHVNLIRRERLRLSSAYGDLELARRQMSRGARLNKTLWKSARKKIDDSATALCEADLGTPVKQLKLYGYVIYLTQLLDILERQVQLTAEISANVRGFRINLTASLVLDNLFAPVLDLIQSRLIKVIEDMEASLARNQFLQYLGKEKQWCLELKALGAFMNFTDKIRLEDVLDTYSGTAAIRSGTEALEDFLAGLSRDFETGPADRVVRSGRALVRTLLQKVKTNVPSGAVIAQCESFIAQIGVARERSNGLLNLTGPFVTSIVTIGLPALRGVLSLVDYAQNRNLTGLTDALKTGDITKALSLDGLTASTEGQITSITARISSLFEADPASSDISGADLIVLSSAFENESRSLALSDSLLSSSPEDHLENAVDREAVGYKNLMATADRVAAQAGNAPLASKQVVLPSLSVV